jgi:hypothetical protein
LAKAVVEEIERNGIWGMRFEVTSNNWVQVTFAMSAMAEKARNSRNTYLAVTQGSRAWGAFYTRWSYPVRHSESPFLLCACGVNAEQVLLEGIRARDGFRADEWDSDGYFVGNKVEI